MAGNYLSIQRKNNFDFIRLLLSLTVFLDHSCALSLRPEFGIITYFFNANIAVNSFFVISGFLVSLSFENSKSVYDYLLKRVRRICPAYVFVVLICALISPILSELSPDKYFSVDLIKYLLANLSFLNFLHPGLPGVFTHNHIKGVNGSLWTIRFEVAFYFLIPFIAILFRRYKKLWVFLLVFISIFLLNMFLGFISAKLQNKSLSLLAFYLPNELLCFMCGVFLFHYFDYFKKCSLWLLLISIACFLSNKFLCFPLLTPFCLCVIVIFFAYKFVYMGNIGKYGDLSYGIYLWHFPVLQTFVSLGLFDLNPYISLAAATIVILFLAYLSWHIVEKTFLRRTSHYRQVAN